MQKDLYAGAGMLAFSVLFYYGAANLGTSFMTDPVGPDGLPKSLALVLGLLSALLILKSLVPMVTRGGFKVLKKADPEARRRHLLALGMLGIGIGYVLIAEAVGYFVGIALVIVVTALYQGTRRTWRLPAIAISGAAFFWFLFVEFLKIDQPPGIWSKLFASLST